MGVNPLVVSDLAPLVASAALTDAPNSSRAFAASERGAFFCSDEARAIACVDLALFYAIWGEGANFRLVPESLSFLFHKCSAEVRRAEALQAEPMRSAGAFLTCVVQPLYKHLAASAPDDSGLKRNYDDANEFFWSRACLECLYFTPDDQAGYFPSVGLHGGELGTGELEFASEFRVFLFVQHSLDFGCR